MIKYILFTNKRYKKGQSCLDYHFYTVSSKNHYLIYTRKGYQAYPSVSGNLSRLLSDGKLALSSLGRHIQGKAKVKNKMEQGYKKSARDPWLLVTSKPHRTGHAKQIVRRYRRRMKIEHEFRNMKNSKWGLGLNETRTLNPKHLEMLLLVGAIVMMMLWLIGLAGEMKQSHYAFQANTIKKHRVLSLIFLGLQILKHCIIKIKIKDVWEALDQAQQHEANLYGIAS